MSNDTLKNFVDLGYSMTWNDMWLAFWFPATRDISMGWV